MEGRAGIVRDCRGWLQRRTWGHVVFTCNYHSCLVFSPLINLLITREICLRSFYLMTFPKELITMALRVHKGHIIPTHQNGCQGSKMSPKQLLNFANSNDIFGKSMCSNKIKHKSQCAECPSVSRTGKVNKMKILYLPASSRAVNGYPGTRE